MISLAGKPKKYERLWSGNNFGTRITPMNQIPENKSLKNSQKDDKKCSVG
jgi:hypothetical protein